MKKIIFMAFAAAFALTFTSCEDMLDSESHTSSNSEVFPATPSDLNKELAALYGVMNQFSTSPLETPWFVNYLMSDDANGAGGTGDVESHAVAHLMANKSDLYDNAWHNTYVGIARASAVISSVDAFDWTGQEKARNQMLGEAYFMRGLFYLWATQFWGDIPAYWGAAAPDPCYSQSADSVIFPHILADFVTATTLMQHGATTFGDGHATKGAAEGFLGRAYLFYEGFYKKQGEMAKATPAAIALPEQEGCTGVSLTKDMVANYLKDAIDNSGYKLVEDFRLLWQYTNPLTIGDYAFTADLAAAGKSWAGNGNSEEMFQVQYMNAGSWNGTIGMGFCNQTSLYCGLRCDDDGAGGVNGKEEAFQFGQGWGQGVINSNLWDDWADNDIRKRATILNAPEEFGADKFYYATSCSEETGYYNKKWMPVTAKSSSFDDFNDSYTWWGVWRKANTEEGAPNGNSFQGDHFCDMVLLRLADVMLMHTELTGDATEMNKVRKRAGLGDLPYSWQAIKAERRWELAGEGLRFNDLRRWSGIDGGASCEAAVALQRQVGSRIYYTGKNEHPLKHANTGWAARYARTNGFLPKPPAQVSLYNNPDILKQNPGWFDTEYDWNMSGTPSY